MKVWMDVMRNIEDIFDDHERLFDAWESGGVDGLVIGPLLLGGTDKVPFDRAGSSGAAAVAAFDPDPAVYRRLGVKPPPAPPPMPEKRVHLERTLSDARRRGWSVWIFQPSVGSGPGGDRHTITDPRSRDAACARIVDTLEHYPMADGGIMDGPEWGYEISVRHYGGRSSIFNDLPESVGPGCADLGYDYGALVSAKDRLFDRLHALRPADVDLHAAGGLLGAFHLLGGDPDLMAWFRFRTDSLTRFFQGIREGIRAEMSRPVKLGVGPRTALLASLCSYDLARLAGFMDILLPKHYFWHRGFDGLIGTVYCYVDTLTDWNPGLTDAEAMAVVGSLFGLVLPGVECRADLESALCPEFFERVVTQETRRSLAAVDDPERVVPWVDAGRSPHEGDPVSAADLGRLLLAAQEAGLQRFLYHHHGNLTSGEWAVMSGLCGRPWRPEESDYRPPDRLVL